MSLPNRAVVIRKCFVAIAIVLAGVIFLTIIYTSSPANSYSFNIPKSLLYSSDNHSHTLLPRVLCLILTSPKYFAARAKVVNETWAPRCDRYFFITEYPDSNMSAEVLNISQKLPIAPIQNLTPGYQHLTQKSTLAFFFAHKNYLNDFDWFIKADDDTYLMVDHLREFLSEQNSSEPVVFGYSFKVKVSGAFHSGGGSYVLSRESLRRFYEAHQVPNTTCRKDGGSEDVEIATCLRTKGVYAGKSLDKQNRELFHPLSFNDHFRGAFPDWLHWLAENPLQSHYNCCSDRSISFHYVHPGEQYLMDFLLYRARSALNTKSNSSKTSVK